MVTRTRIQCDVRDCEEDAAFRITHEILHAPTYISQRRGRIDLCLRHAEAFTIGGRGGINTGGPPVDPQWDTGT